MDTFLKRVYRVSVSGISVYCLIFLSYKNENINGVYI